MLLEELELYCLACLIVSKSEKVNNLFVSLSNKPIFDEP